MAGIDVTDLFTDPDFVDAMQVVTRYPQTSTFGENFMKETVVNSVGSIQPADYKTLERFPQALQNENYSSFWFKGKIIATEPGKYSSVLIFKGFRYQVKQVADWTNWGAGWCEGICVAEVPA